MVAATFTGNSVVVNFKENPLNGAESMYIVEYVCANRSVSHYVDQAKNVGTDEADGMRLYVDTLTFDEHQAAGLKRELTINVYTVDANQNVSPPLEITASNPAPPIPEMYYYNGYDSVQFNFTMPTDEDWAGFCVWADTQTPVRKDEVNSKYIGPLNTVNLDLLEDTDYWITFAAYDAFGTDLLNEATIQLHTLPKDSILLPVLQERLDHLEARQIESSTAFVKLANGFSTVNHRAVEGVLTYVDEQGALVAERFLQLETRVGDSESLYDELQQTMADEDEALSQSITTMGARIGDAEAAIVREANASVTRDSAMSLRLDQQASRIANNEAQFNDQIQTLVDADGALSQRITDQAAVWNSDIDGKVTAAIQSITTAYSNADGALSERIDNQSAVWQNDIGNSVLAATQSITSAFSNADGALGERIDQITAGYDGQFVSIQQSMSAQGSAIDGLQAQWTLRIDNNGRVSGFGLASDPNGNSEMAFLADRFLIAHPNGAEVIFEVVNGQVRMRQAIISNLQVDMAQITNLEVDTLQIRGGAVSIMHVLTAGDTYVAAETAVNVFETGWLVIGDGIYGTAAVDVEFTLDGTLAYDTACRFFLFVDTGGGWIQAKSKTIGISTNNGDTYFRMDGSLSHIVEGSQVRIALRANPAAWLPSSVARNVWVRDIGISVSGAKR